MISQFDALDSLSGSTDLARRRVGSVSSVGLHTVTSGLPSPPSITSGPPPRRGGSSSIFSLGNTSPMSTSPTSARREFPTSQYVHNSPLGQPSAEPQSERTATTSAGSDQNYQRVLPVESKEARTLLGLSSGPSIEPKMSGTQSSPLGSPQRSTRTPTQLQYCASDSSKSSKASPLSSGSTATSSLLPSASAFDGEKRSALSLPPLATLGPLSSSKGSTHTKQATRPGLQPLASRKTSSIAPDQPSQPPFTSSSSTGRKFESLQLPLPYNVSFGQRPLPRSDSCGKLANIFDLQDMSRERSLLGDLNLDQEERGATPTIIQGPPEPRHPPHHPSLPSLPSVSRDDTHDLFPQQADALSVLAYAGRIVGRDRGTPRPP